jgi:hypothetical protein
VVALLLHESKVKLETNGWPYPFGNLANSSRANFIPDSAFFRVSPSDSAKATETKRADAQRMRVRNLVPDPFARWRRNAKKLATGVGRVKESFPPKVVSGLCDLRPFPAFGFFKQLSVSNG